MPEGDKVFQCQNEKCLKVCLFFYFPFSWLILPWSHVSMFLTPSTRTEMMTNMTLVFSWSQLFGAHSYQKPAVAYDRNFVKKFDVNPSFMKEILMQRNITYKLRHGNDAQLPKVCTTSFGIETIAFFGNRMWQVLPHEIKDSSTLPIFRKQIKCW